MGFSYKFTPERLVQPPARYEVQKRYEERKPGRIFSHTGSQSARMMNSSLDLNESLERGSTISSIAVQMESTAQSSRAGNDDALVTKTIMQLKKELEEKELQVLEMRNH